MKPLAMMMRLKVMDATETVLEEIGPFQAVPLNDLLILRMSKEEAKSLQESGSLDMLQKLALEKGKTILILPIGAEILEVSQKWEAKKD